MPSSRGAPRALGHIAGRHRGCAADRRLWWRASGCAEARRSDDHTTAPAGVLGARDPSAIARGVAFAGRDVPSAPRGDGPLAELARTCARTAGCSDAALAAEARAAGLVDAQLALVTVTARQLDLLPAALAGELAAPLRAVAATHVGVFVAEDRVQATVVMSRRPLALAPVPQQLPVGGVLPLRATLLARYADVKLRVLGPDGESWLSAGSGPEVNLQVALPSPGCYALTLIGGSGERSETLAVIIAAAGPESDPRDCAAKHVPPPAASARREALEGELLHRITALRATHGLRPLAPDARLSERAMRAARDHDELPAASAVASGVGGGLALLAQASAPQPSALFDALEAGPGRATLLDPDATHIGLAAVPRAAGWIATALVAQLDAPANVERVPAQVLQALNRNRALRAAPALRPDATLTEAARRAVRAFFDTPALSEREIVTRANAELERFGLHYRRIGALAVLVADPLEAAALEPALDPSAGAVGVAAASGMRPGQRERSLAVVIALGWER